jgi:hypothetical protein
VQNVRLHWLVSFHPFLFPALAVCFDDGALRRMLRPMAGYALLITAVIGVALMLPVELLRGQRSYASIILGTHPEEVIEALAPYRDRYLLTTPSYAKSAVVAFHFGQDVPVIGPGSYHARQDDLLTDFRSLAGRDIMILTHRADQIEAARAWFDEADVRTINIRGAALTVLFGRGFRYEVYRTGVLQPIGSRYYAMPVWLERFARPGFFGERYSLGPSPVAAGH